MATDQQFSTKDLPHYTPNKHPISFYTTTAAYNTAAKLFNLPQKETIMKVYQLTSSYNAADTCRDADDIYTSQEGIYSTIEKALAAGRTYVKTKFFTKCSEFHECSDGTWACTDCCPYGTTLTITPINVD